MSETQYSVDEHYGVGGVLDAIRGGLIAMGKDIENLMPSDLAPVDEFHIRGREATIELADRAGITPGLRVLDVGSGLGGSVRYLAAERECLATGIDLTKEYVEVASALARLVGLEGRVDFHLGSALELPFDGSIFDVVWTEHVQMNIENKDAFYTEIARVLRPGGRLVFHDIFQGDGSDPHYPAPWAENSAISFLASPDTLQRTLEQSGFRIRDWADKSQHSLEWFAAIVEKIKESGPPLLGTHLLMGDTAKVKFQNQVRNLQEQRIVVIQAVAEKK
ncbi:MAG: SAM-dependent methyltransferase [Acidiferrobacterales bacterium]